MPSNIKLWTGMSSAGQQSSVMNGTLQCAGDSHAMTIVTHLGIPSDVSSNNDTNVIAGYVAAVLGKAAAAVSDLSFEVHIGPEREDDGAEGEIKEYIPQSSVATPCAIPLDLIEQAGDIEGVVVTPPLSIEVIYENGQLHIKVPEVLTYGDYPGEAVPIVLEQADGKLQLRLYDDHGDDPSVNIIWDPKLRDQTALATRKALWNSSVANHRLCYPSSMSIKLRPHPRERNYYAAGSSISGSK